MSKRTFDGHLKKEEMINNLAKRAFKTLSERHLTEAQTNPICPEVLIQPLQSIREKLNEAQRKRMSNEDVLKPLLQRLSDQQLSKLTDIFNRNGCTEDKLMAVSMVILKEDYDFIMNSMNYMEALKQKLVSSFVKSYSVEFSLMRGSSYQFNNEEFKRQVRAVQSYRAGMMHAIQSQDQAPVEEGDNGSRCLVM